LLYYRFFFFSKEIKMKTQRRFVHRAPAPRHFLTVAPGLAVLSVSYLSSRNLDVDSGFPFLVSALSIFLIANISMISAFRSRHPTNKASKKTAHSIHASREPKSDAKLQPFPILTKYFRNFF